MENNPRKGQRLYGPPVEKTAQGASEAMSIHPVPSSGRLARWLRPLPPGIVLGMARLLAHTRELRPYPGWYFGIAMESENTRSRLRAGIWRYCNERRLELPIIMKWYGGIRVHTYVGNDTSSCFFVGGCYEPNEFFFLDSFLGEGMTFVDVGANEGLFTLFASKKVGMRGRIFALEPSQRDFSRLTDNLRLNKSANVKALQLGASDHNGKAELIVAGYQHEGHNTLGRLSYEASSSRIEKIELRRLDDLLDGEKVDGVDVVKIDVEGAEKKVIMGMQETIRRYRPALLVEVFDNALRTQGSSCEELLEILRSLGYRLFIFTEEKGLAAPLEGEPKGSENILALPDESVEWILQA